MTRPRANDGRWRDDWCTPEDELEAVRALGEIALDPCWNPSAITAPRKAYALDGVTHSLRDGLIRDWAGDMRDELGAGVVFVNPPFSELDRWLAKCALTWDRLGDDMYGRPPVSIVSLVPARVGHWAITDVIHTARFVAFRKNRTKFLHADGGKSTTAGFATCHMVWTEDEDAHRHYLATGRYWCAEVRT